MDNRRLGRDLLSDLPVGIIESILTRLPIQQAIRTSVLSTRWRNRWVTIPHLVFDGDRIVSFFDERDNIVSLVYGLNELIDRMHTFITWALSRHQGPLHKFKLTTSDDIESSDIDQWLLFLSMKDIKELNLQSISGNCDSVIVSCSLYSLRNLTFLKLHGCTFDPPPPTFKGFFCLRTLILRYVDVEVPSDAIESLVANSPLLETLECTAFQGSPRLGIRINAPNLKNFHLECIMCIVKEIYLCAPLLAKMCVTFHDEDRHMHRVELPQPKHSVCNYTEFLGGFTNLECLTGDEYFTKYLSMGIEYYHHPLVLHHLEVITLLRVNFKDIDEILVVIRLIMDAANLRELQVRSYVDRFNEGDAPKAPHLHFWDSDCPQNCTFQKLKVIEITRFRGAHHERKFIKFLLESSPVLETMIIESCQSSTNLKARLNSTTKLLGYSRASTNAKILFKTSIWGISM